MQKRELGRSGLKFPPSALAAWASASAMPQCAFARRKASRLIRAAVERGVTFFDTAEVYGPFDNEEVVGEALRPFRDQVVIATKFGFDFDPETRENRGVNSRPERIRAGGRRLAEAPRHRDHRPALPAPRRSRRADRGCGRHGQRLIAEGKVKHFGMSEPGVQTLRRAHAVQPVTALQNEYSLWWRAPETNGILDACDELGIGFVPYSPLGKGFLTGAIEQGHQAAAKATSAASIPRFQPEAMDKNQAFVDLLKRVADEKGATPAQIALAWLLAQRPYIVPIPGTTKLHRLEENIGAADVELTMTILREIDEGASHIQAEGDRYAPAQMAMAGREAPDKADA